MSIPHLLQKVHNEFLTPLYTTTLWNAQDWGIHIMRHTPQAFPASDLGG